MWVIKYLLNGKYWCRGEVWDDDLRNAKIYEKKELRPGDKMRMKKKDSRSVGVWAELEDEKRDFEVRKVIDS